MMAKLFPALLAGPIIRRVDASKVTIWIATSSDYNIDADVFNISTKDESDLYTLLNTNTTTQTIHLGKNLFIHLAHLTPMKNDFPTNQLLGYNLKFTNEKESFDLGDLGLLEISNPHKITYDNFNFPTFYIPSETSEGKFIFGSCRKPHGKGEDTLSLGDTDLSTNSRDLTKRPQAIFLMGDQIYADDVADSLFPPIRQFSKQLMGEHEDLEQIDKRLAKNQCYKKINGRKEIMKEFANLTSGNSSNHLMEFGEYAAMYLLSWSPVLWEVAKDCHLFETFDETFDKEGFHLKLPRATEKMKKMEKAQLQKRFTEQEQAIQQSYLSTYKIRRLFANTPTYMIFDDHDITDDWNITADWKRAVESTSLGKHIIANGLAAYFAFQGWGNDPEIFTEYFIAKMKKHFQLLQEGKMMEDYSSWVKLLFSHQTWHFVAPTAPKAVFLDTRTMREYDNKPNLENEEGSFPPQLVNEQQFNEITKQLHESGWKKGTPLIVISATPVIGFDFIEKTIMQFLPILNSLGLHVSTVFDIEAWRYNGKGLTNLLNQLKDWQPHPCIILSGDVHYSYSANSLFSFEDGKELHVNQITSSPLKNMSFHNLGLLVKIVAAFDRLLQQKQTIYRYCNPQFKIESVNEDELPTEEFLWKEQLNYDLVDRFSIMETDNALGSLTFTKDDIKNLYHKF